MANHTIDLSAERERRLAIIVAEYNARNPEQPHARRLAPAPRPRDGDRPRPCGLGCGAHRAIAAPGGSGPERGGRRREGAAAGAGFVTRASSTGRGPSPDGGRGAADMSHEQWS